MLELLVVNIARGEIMNSDMLTKIKNLQLPHRFEHKLITDIEFLLSSDIPSLESIILFGSCARNELRITSDIDLLIITTTPLERAVRGELASILEEDIDNVHTDGIFYTREQYINSTRIFTSQIKKEGIVLYEKFVL